MLQILRWHQNNSSTHPLLTYPHNKDLLVISLCHSTEADHTGFGGVHKGFSFTLSSMEILSSIRIPQGIT